MRTMWPIAVLALLVGISGCFPYYRDWRGNRYGQEQRDTHYTDTSRDPPSRDCWRQGNDWVCRRD
jgi:hypothetical protein